MNPTQYAEDPSIHQLRRLVNPVIKANPVVRFTFWWLREVFQTGLKRPIEESDIYETLSSHQSEQLSYLFDNRWRLELKKQKASFLRVICGIYGWTMITRGLMYTTVDSFSRVFQPLCLGGLVSYFAPGQTTISRTEAYYYAAGIVFCSLVPVVIFHHFILYIYQIGMKIRVACCSLLYKKALRITKAAGTDGLTGQVINLMSNDVAKFDTAASFVHDTWKGPIELVVFGYLIYRQIGVAGLIGIAFLLSFIPLQAWVGKKAASYRLKTAIRTDRRVRFMNEIIQGIQVIKMYAWEHSFSRMVDTIRRKEITGIRGTLFIRAGLLSFNLVSRLSIFLSLVGYCYSGNVFTAKQVFIVTSYFNLLYSSMLHFWPLSLTSVAEGLISIRRIEEFLLLPERKMVQVPMGRAAAANGHSGTEESEIKLMENVKMANGDGAIKLDSLALATGKVHSKRFVNKKGFARRGIFMRDGTACWSKESSGERRKVVGIREVNLSVEKSKMCAIVGPVGSGKSTLLQVILGELELDDGRLEISGDISYASQEPWLFEGSVKNNIVFTEDFHEKRYREVVKVCALEKDFQLLPHGDDTIVGERGISLSGGQRARVGLARAIYRKADIYLLDDPLSAVDTHVGKHIFEECIRDYLNDKVCVLVTHQLQYLKNVEHIVLMNMGSAEAQGTYRSLEAANTFPLLAAMEQEQLAQRDKQMADFVDPEGERERQQRKPLIRMSATVPRFNIDKGYQQSAAASTPIIPPAYRMAHSNQSLYHPSPFSSCSMVFDGFDDYQESTTTAAAGRRRRKAKRPGTSTSGSETADDQQRDECNHLATEGSGGGDGGGGGASKESQITGTIGFSVYRSYFASVESVTLIALVAALFLLAQCTMSGIDYFVSQWVNQEEHLSQNVTGSDNSTAVPSKLEGTVFAALAREQYLMIYSGAMAIMLCLSLNRSFSFFYLCLRASIRLHDQLFRGITRATMYFFNTNPSGRILNRFSRDIGCIDIFLPSAMMDCILFFVEFTAIISLVAVVNCWLLLPTAVMGIMFYGLRHIYTNTARSIKRVEALTRSPIFSHANASFQGLTTIRAFEAEKILAYEFDKHQDLNTSAWYLFLATTRAFALWLELVCVLYIAAVTFSFLMMENTMSGNVGLAITQVFNLIFMCQWGMRQTAELENQMTSVERVVEYAEVEPEPPLETVDPLRKPADNWPAQGAIKFEYFSLRYSPDSEPVLKDLNLAIEAKEKIGIVGRTGAGKSSIIQALFRLAVNEGLIKVDGVDIGVLGLHDLRKKISIIPQDPVLFSGRVRENLDPFGQHSDEDMWRALEQVELRDSVQRMDGGLDGKMSDGGSNFSMGQRQLVCLARAILRNNKILILDEATANVDPETDKLIQKTIRVQFGDCTVLTIAHRLHTVMDSDRVLVMDAGRAVEFGHPHELLRQSNGFLRKLVNQTGETTAAQLTAVAERNFRKRCTADS
ncbi:ATP-binding cassette sub-family C member 4-like [Topomyia yanbarensis]|uniref:ATP-binding cassette sub-family C member 4-like n=1 Tax=Topomyia yanbarensis TaxID=2498891 RepID=UPI00273C2E2C|nr:ATP-binding cassette sub-family C member 4-like [Topomyia yanbarensis]XP_058839983.1 ATP-binding cassette sub-family C member 4-like [Topomyia yanbarensis]XP_058839984.1 ATP-binding cassette sub-family C member 4-like [Topomyia yanbarensis]